MDELGVTKSTYEVKEIGYMGGNFIFVWGLYELYTQPDTIVEYGK